MGLAAVAFCFHSSKAFKWSSPVCKERKVGCHENSQCSVFKRFLLLDSDVQYILFIMTQHCILLSHWALYKTFWFFLNFFSRNMINGVLIWRTECIWRGFFFPFCGKFKSITLCSFCWSIQLVITGLRMGLELKLQGRACWKSTSRGRCLSNGSKTYL